MYVWMYLHVVLLMFCVKFFVSLNVENKLLTCVCDFFVNFFRLGLWFSIYITFFSAVKNNNILWDRDFAYFFGRGI